MRRLVPLLIVLSLVVMVGSVPPASAYSSDQGGGWKVSPCGADEGNTHNNFNSGWGHQERVCELRTMTIKLGGTRLGVKSENGGMEVTGEERGAVLIKH